MLSLPLQVCMLSRDNVSWQQQVESWALLAINDVCAPLLSSTQQTAYAHGTCTNHVLYLLITRSLY